MKIVNNKIVIMNFVISKMSLYYPKGPISVEVRNSSLQTGEICSSIDQYQQI
jgi:hypothetical protein